MRTTIRDIAQETGLSITTVSLILNGKGKKFPPDTKDLVLAAAKKLNYRPNQLAVGLLKKHTQTLGLIIPDISNVFFSEFAKGVEDRGREEQYSIILCNSDDRFHQEQQSINILADRGVDGIIIILSSESFGSKNEECLVALRATGKPVILADCFNEVVDFSTMEIDNRKGSALAVEHLVSLGHSRIACITGPQGLKSNKERMAGFTTTMRDHDIPLDDRLIFEGDFRYQSGYDGALKLLKDCPTAIYCHNDMMAFGALRALRDSGIRVPKDVSLVGFDDVFFSRYMEVPLTTVKQPIYKMGRQTASLLLEEIDNHEKAPQHVVFAPRLVVRASTAAPAR